MCLELGRGEAGPGPEGQQSWGRDGCVPRTILEWGENGASRDSLMKVHWDSQCRSPEDSGGSLQKPISGVLCGGVGLGTEIEKNCVHRVNLNLGTRRQETGGADSRVRKRRRATVRNPGWGSLNLLTGRGWGRTSPPTKGHQQSAFHSTTMPRPGSPLRDQVTRVRPQSTSSGPLAHKSKLMVTHPSETCELWSGLSPRFAGGLHQPF